MYAGTFLRLDWICMGQRPIEIQVPGDRSFGNAVPLSKGREEIERRLQHMFELGNDL